MTFADAARKALEHEKKRPAEEIARDVEDKYPGIRLEDAEEIRKSLVSVLEARSREEQQAQIREYKALHSRLAKQYRKSGKK